MYRASKVIAMQMLLPTLVQTRYLVQQDLATLVSIFLILIHNGPVPTASLCSLKFLPGSELLAGSQ